jgi:hypothetical protein
MTKNTKPQPLSIDLNQFKLHINVKNEIKLTLHFDSPSRKFYLSVIALVVMEMKKAGKITSILLEDHIDVLRLLNETIGGGAGSSERKNMCLGSAANGNTSCLTWKRPHFSRSSEEERNMTRGLARPIPSPRPKKIAGQIFLNTKGAKRM